MRTYKYYTLINSTDDEVVGGVKLTYWCRTVSFKVIKVKWFLIKVPIIKSVSKRKKLVFLRPLKQFWDNERNKLPLNFWGKKNDPMTNMWIKVHRDYKDINFDTVIFIEHIKDHSLIKRLKEQSESFTIEV